MLLATVGVLSLPAFAQIATTALPSGGVVAAGNAAISQAGTAMRVDQTSNKAVIDWQSFNIGRDASVRFVQPSASSIALNRIGADNGRSIIDGSLTANGQVWLLNPGGVLFGPSARVDVGGLLAGSLKLGNEDFMSGSYRFTRDGAGSIVNQGTLTAADGGYIALLAPEVRNEGVIAARLGTVALVSGDEVRVDFAGDRLIEIRVDQAAVNGLIDNRNLVEAEGGWVLMSAGAASDLATGAINNTGVVRANSLSDHGGIIRLEAGFIALGGTISADGATGGTIQVASGRDLSLADGVSARGLGGKGGSISYSAGGRIIETSTSHTDVSGQSDGGAIHVVADGGILSSGWYSAVGANGQGGRIDLSGSSVRLLSATLDASGITQGGLVRVGGAFQGGKAQDSASDRYRRYIGRFGAAIDLPNAQQTFINDSSSIDVSAKGGSAGATVIWSDAQTTFLGSIQANGGAVEISSAGDLRYVNLAGLDVGSGFLLLDPKNIVIGDFPTAGTWTYQAILGKGYSGGKNVDVSSLEANDNFGLAVALNGVGDRLAVGATGDAGSGNGTPSSGAVRLFSFTDTNFSGAALQATIGKGYSGGKNIDVSSLEANDIFGNSVALNAAGDRLAVGAPWDDGSGNSSTNSGAVRLFSFTDTNFSGGALQATLGKGYAGSKNVDVSSLEANDYFGFSVSLNSAGDRLAVGTVFDGGSGNSVLTSGAVHLFSFTDTNFSGGALQATLGKSYSGGKNLDVSSLEATDQFGHGVALNAAGDRLAVGAVQDGGNGNSTVWSGAVYLFSFTDSNFSGGALQATIGKGYTGGKNIDVSSLEANDYFGSSVALNAAGDRLAVGAYVDDGSGNVSTNSGAVRLFSFTDTNFSGGTLQATIGKGYTGGNNVDVGNLEAGDVFGRYVSLNAAGDRLAVGAYGDSGAGNGATGSGAVYLFSYATQPVASLSFATNPGTTENIDRAGLQALLSAGTNVTLQASNDIILNAGSDLIVNNPSGNGGQLSLFSGRSVLINSSITTDNGILDVNANSAQATGVVDADRDPGAANITMAAGTSINAGTGTVSIGIGTGAGLTDSTGGDISLENLIGGILVLRNQGGGNISANGSVIASSLDLSGSNVTATFANAANNIGTLSADVNSLYFVNSGDLTIGSGTYANGVTAANRWLIYVPSPASLTLNGLIADFVHYNADYSTYAPGSVTESGNGFIYASADPNYLPPAPVTGSPAITVAESRVSQESATEGFLSPSTVAGSAPEGGIGNGGATMGNFPAATSQVTSIGLSPETPLLPASLIVDATKSVPRRGGVLDRADLQAMTRQAHEAGTQLYADALAVLAENPRAADIGDCVNGGDELCIAKPLAGQDEGYGTGVKRKVAVLIGNNAYRSPIPELDTPINDVTEIRAQLRDKLGYEVKVVENAGRKEIVDSLNHLIRNTDRNDSVLVMYAGHGYLQEATNTGYWIPTDASISSPDRWISNDTIARALANIPAKQVMLIADSCYSGTLTKEGKVVKARRLSREQTLTRRSVLSLSSGGDEPVSDEGYENHSIFAWNMIQALGQLQDETSGEDLHVAIKEAVTRDFPQVPQYGTVVSAGHAEGGEYLLTPKKDGTR